RAEDATTYGNGNDKDSARRAAGADPWRSHHKKEGRRFSRYAGRGSHEGDEKGWHLHSAGNRPPGESATQGAHGPQSSYRSAVADQGEDGREVQSREGC